MYLSDNVGKRRSPEAPEYAASTNCVFATCDEFAFSCWTDKEIVSVTTRVADLPFLNIYFYHEINIDTR